MAAAAQYLIGEHNFTSYRALACQAKSPLRSMYSLDVSRSGEFVYLDVCANAFLHHMVRNFRTQYDVFEKLCVAGAELNDPLTAFHEIDRVLAACDRFKRPVYLEIPRDMVHVRPETAPPYQKIQPRSDSRALAEAVEEAAGRIESARQPVLLLGVEVHRFGLQDAALQLAESTGIPMAATMLGKGVVAETHSQYMGLYEGALGPQEVTKYVESSDCVIMLGTFMTDINLGIYTAELDISDCIYATSEQLRIRHHHYHDVRLEDFLNSLVHRGLKVTAPLPEAPTDWKKEPFELRPGDAISISRMIRRLDEQLEDDTIVVFTADHGDMLGSRGQYKKQRPWDESIRVPFLLRWPAGLGGTGRMLITPINTPDILPTLLGLRSEEHTSELQSH